MIAPVRVQISRAKGWRMPENTVKVDQSTKWGAPFVAGKTYPTVGGDLSGSLCGQATNATVGCAVDAFRAFAADPAEPMGDLSPLRGENLACWCRRGAPCHADVLLEIANRPVCEALA